MGEEASGWGKLIGGTVGGLVFGPQGALVGGMAGGFVQSVLPGIDDIIGT